MRTNDFETALRELEQHRDNDLSERDERISELEKENEVLRDQIVDLENAGQ